MVAAGWFSMCQPCRNMVDGRLIPDTRHLPGRRVSASRLRRRSLGDLEAKLEHELGVNLRQIRNVHRRPLHCWDFDPAYGSLGSYIRLRKIPRQKSVHGRDGACATCEEDDGDQADEQQLQ